MKIFTFNCSGEFNIDQFGDFDLFFIQRCLEFMPDTFPYQTNYIRNYTDPTDPDNAIPRGLCIVSKDIPLDNHIETDEFLDIIIGASEGQGRCWQRLSINTLNGIYDIINGLPSYPTEEYIDKFGSLRNENNEDYGTPIPYEVYISQASELLNMVNDNNTLLVSDMHDKDSCLPKELNCNKRNLINHIPESTTTFTNHPGLDGEFGEDSLDKIITTKNSNMKISNIEVHRYVRNVTEGHWPISFNVEWSG